MEVSRVSKKGLTTVPARVRRVLGVEEGDVLIWKVDEKRNVAIVKAVKNPIKFLKGRYDDPNLTYERIEEIADRLIVRESRANDRT